MSLYLHSFNRIAALPPLEMAQRLAGDPRDEAVLCQLCTQAQDSPTARRALHWALANNLKVSLVQREPGALGTYSTLDGYIRLNIERGELGLDAVVAGVGTLVHEIRHAWQDQNRLLPHMRNNDMRYGRLEYALLQNALVEADAHVYGMMAMAEIKFGRAESEALSQQQRLDAMRDFFHDWFVSRAQSYGDKMREQHAASFVRQGEGEVTETTGINPYCRTELVRLGRDFSGNANYIMGIDPDHFTKFYLSPEAVLRDYANDASAKGTDVRVNQMRNRTSLYAQLRAGR